MMTTQSISKKHDRSVAITLLSSVIITLFLFYIDEGFYNFNWMTDLGNWFVFGFYISLIFGSQILVYTLLKNGKILNKNLSWSIVIGTTLALLLAFFVIFT